MSPEEYPALATKAHVFICWNFLNNFTLKERGGADTIKELRDWVLQLGEVTEAPHKFGGTEFRLQNREFMHNHGPRHLDIRLSKEDQERMLKEGKAEPHQFAPQAGWVTFRIRSEEDVETAKELIRLAYNNARKVVAFHSVSPAAQNNPGP